MRCPVCDIPNTNVVDSRIVDEGTARRRRHLCVSGHRFTTMETYIEVFVSAQKDNLLPDIQRAIQLLLPVAERMEKRLPATDIMPRLK